MTQYLGASPFQSDELDRLAEAMVIPEVLKESKSRRYFKVHYLKAGCLSYIDRVFFDSEYLNSLLPDELLAVGAHEFTHIKERHATKLFYRIFGSAIAVAAVIGYLVFVNFELIDSILFFSNSGKGLSSLFVAALSYMPAWFASFCVNAKLNRRQETECDLNTVKFADGEAMISALIKLSGLRPKKTQRFKSRLLPVTYPTLDQRIKDIRSAMEGKPNRLRHSATPALPKFDFYLPE